MAKKIFFESAIHQFCMAVTAATNDEHFEEAEKLEKKRILQSWIQSCEFRYLGKKKVSVTWRFPKNGYDEFSFEKCLFYQRGDQSSIDPYNQIEDIKVKDYNAEILKEIIINITKNLLV